MAIPAQGITITWGMATLGEIREIEIDQERGLPAAREDAWTLARGTVRLSGFSAASVPESDYGRSRTLAIAASTGPLFSGRCVYLDRTLRLEANDAVRFDHVFRIIDGS